MLHRALLLTSIVVFVVSVGATLSLLARSMPRGRFEESAAYPAGLPTAVAGSSVPTPVGAVPAPPVIGPVIGHAGPVASPAAAALPAAAASPAAQPAPATPAAATKPAETRQAAPAKPAEVPPLATIEVDWPKAMELNRSDTLTVTLQKREDGSASASASAPNHVVAEATFVPLVPPVISSPGVSAADLDVFALVRLDAPCFKPDARDFDLQPISEMPLTWTFSIVAVCDGTQRIGLTVYTVAISRRSNEQVGQRLPI
jgi:hypothetical protein